MGHWYLHNLSVGVAVVERSDTIDGVGAGPSPRALEAFGPSHPTRFFEEDASI